MDPATTFHLMKKVGVIRDVAYSKLDHAWVIELFDTYIGSYALSYSMEDAEEWVARELMPLITACKRAADE